LFVLSVSDSDFIATAFSVLAVASDGKMETVVFVTSCLLLEGTSSDRTLNTPVTAATLAFVGSRNDDGDFKSPLCGVSEEASPRITWRTP